MGIPATEAFPEKRTSSGLGDSSIDDSSNPELDALSKMVVDKVLEKIKNDGGVGLKGHQQKGQNSATTVSSTSALPVSPNNCDTDKTEMAVTQMRHLLQRERNLVSELQVRKPRFVKQTHLDNNEILNNQKYRFMKCRFFDTCTLCM